MRTSMTNSTEHHFAELVREAREIVRMVSVSGVSPPWANLI